MALMSPPRGVEVAYNLPLPPAASAAVSGGKKRKDHGARCLTRGSWFSVGVALLVALWVALLGGRKVK
eukprot:CAMPEP_0174885868 /NCGR_PEP_ID=MMETSP0167-20121228/1146_1 /TAXON_ID=38298 /ORGANISM="Rhodella maculata, Strain CCMP736" /LENGTH=67 /DNA_ID=CAMNT_0016121609 /DNA_START=78 /DNA_END=278 /DNA_ORIENTATION=-